MTSRDARIAIIGFGLRASLARTIHRPGEGALVSVVVDPDARARARAAEYLGDDVMLVSTIDEALAEHLDGALVLTPDHLHVAHAVQLLEAGVPTFLEKPIATTIEDADRILDAAYRTRTPLYIGHNMRHMPVITAMRDAILAGRIGDVKAVWCRHFVSAGGDFYFKDWHADSRNSTGLLLQKGSHDIDVIHWLAGGYSTRVAAIGSLSVYGAITDRRDNSSRRMWDWYSLDNWPPTAQTELAPVLDVEDISMANMVLNNGVLASYQQCHFTPDYWRNYTVIGTAGRMENFGDGPDAVIKVWTSRTDDYHDQADEIIPLPKAPPGGHGGADELLIDEFLRFLDRSGSTVTSPLAARNAVAAAVMATRSLRSRGEAIDVPAPRSELVAYFGAGQGQSPEEATAEEPVL